MKLTVEPDRCCGSGQCVVLALDVFDQDDDGIVVLLEDEPTQPLHEKVGEKVIIRRDQDPGGAGASTICPDEIALAGAEPDYPMRRTSGCLFDPLKPL
ncbi:ferredoxin [Streptomyces chartreusis]|uniref:Ferredoxin n=1 Tax=Streptomyces chartreusis TaxID=1969 RepID=A0A7I0NSV8_STRCX|nr:ferredoxin [Streptomyces chartreusis]